MDFSFRLKHNPSLQKNIYLCQARNQSVNFTIPQCPELKFKSAEICFKAGAIAKKKES